MLNLRVYTLRNALGVGINGLVEYLIRYVALSVRLLYGIGPEE